MFQHLIYALNKIMIILRDGKGLNKRTIVDGGKVLFRLSKVVQAYVYKKNKENISAEEFAKRFLRIVDDANTIFNGGVIPSLR